MASTFNAKKVHKDGKSELTIGVDENAKTLDGIGNTLSIKNADGTNAKIAKENIPFLPDNVSETNKLVTQEDLKEMMTELTNIMESTIKLAKIVGGYNDGNGKK